MMKAIFSNQSQSTVISVVNNQSIVIPPATQQNFDLQNNAVLELYIDKESAIEYQKFFSTICTSFEFNVSAIYQVINANACENVIINLYGYNIGGDNRESYSFVSPISNQVGFQLLSLNVLKYEHLINEIERIDTEDKQLKEKNKLSKKDENKIEFFVHVIGTLFSGIPVFAIIYFFVKDALSKFQILAIIFGIVVFVCLLIYGTQKFTDKFFSREKPTTNTPRPKRYVEFMFNENYIRKIIFDKERYQNKL